MDELVQNLCLFKDEMEQGKFGSFVFFFYLDFQFLRVFNLNISSQLNKFYRLFMLHMPGHLLDIFCHIQVSSISIWPCSGFMDLVSRINLNIIDRVLLSEFPEFSPTSH